MTSRLKKTTVFQVVFDNNIGDSIEDELKLHFLSEFDDENESQLIFLASEGTLCRFSGS